MVLDDKNNNLEDKDTKKKDENNDLEISSISFCYLGFLVLRFDLHGLINVVFKQHFLYLS
uniref:Uncharacterized protein n=1 Tax=Rhizophagus irregularis (strain DAOM 181602 / DAOM 197198 / MUCL 43194) TaxID=747089 RepID=U9TTZ0_RHIID